MRTNMECIHAGLNTDLTQIELVCWVDSTGKQLYCNKFRCNRCKTVFISKGETSGIWDIQHLIVG